MFLCVFSVGALHRVHLERELFFFFFSTNKKQQLTCSKWRISFHFKVKWSHIKPVPKQSLSSVHFTMRFMYAWPEQNASSQITTEWIRKAKNILCYLLFDALMISCTSTNARPHIQNNCTVCMKLSLNEHHEDNAA